MERVEAAVAIDIPVPLVTSALQKKLEALSHEPMATDNVTFFPVSAHIQLRNKHLYEPRMVAIGPYSRSDEPSLREMEWGKPSLREMEWVKPSLRTTESLKLRYFQSFCSRSGNRSINYYLDLIQVELEPRARQCYFKPIELSKEKFVEMLLLDGCFIIEFLIKWNEQDKDGLFAAEWSLPLVRGDLLLLENQIPFFVLEKLFELMDSQTPSLMDLIKKYLKVEEERGSLKDKGFHHLLHLYYHYYVKKPAETGSKQQTQSTGGCDQKRSPTTNPTATENQKAEVPRKNQIRLSRTIPTATKLLNAGVTIKKKNQNQNQNCLSSFLDVTFSDGVLEISFLSVENSTMPLFSNLVAFEQCGGCKLEEAYMTSYAVFMDCLIDTPEDVAVLRERGILENKLASDKELADFFNGLSDWATLDYDKHYLAGLFQDVTDYCGSNWPKWWAKLLTDYCSSPWAIISVIAASVLLFLTILQTVYIIDTYYHAS